MFLLMCTPEDIERRQTCFFTLSFTGSLGLGFTLNYCYNCSTYIKIQYSIHHGGEGGVQSGHHWEKIASGWL
jgi:recombinational DNA repair protein (RecF pathway)